jgi:type II secretory pathway component PulJ
MRRRGTTIIEVVTAMVILSIALPPLVQSFASASMQSILPAQATVASFLAVERMEELVARRYRGTDGYASVTTANFPDESPVTGFPAYSRTITITYMGYVGGVFQAVGSDQGYKKVRVTVTWEGGARQSYVERIFADF